MRIKKPFSTTIATIEDFRMSKYFKSDADITGIRCRGTICGCGGNNRIYKVILSLLDSAREKAGIPFVITSGCRCSKHNKNVSKHTNSDHVSNKTGLACCGVDIRARNDRERFLIVSAALEVGFDRIGINYEQNFIHLGLSYRNDSEVIWRY